MKVGADLPDQPAGGERYARFSLRLRAFAIDFMLFSVVLVASLSLAVALQSDPLSRAVGYTVVIGILLYEPLLVSLAGGTIGHLLSNLRVVDDRTHANVSFLKAVARAVIKAVLSWYSFLSMAVARRHQAMHDLLTRSTVQIRDHAKASPHHFSSERADLPAAGGPSRVRRILVIGAYLVLSVIVLFFAMHGLRAAGALSDDCLLRDRCSDSERILNIVLGSAWIIAAVLCIGLGWRGRLLGCRIRSQTA